MSGQHTTKDNTLSQTSRPTTSGHHICMAPRRRMILHIIAIRIAKSMIDTGLGTSASSELAFRMAPGQARPTPTISPEIPLRASWRRGRNRGSATRRAQEGPKPPAKRKASKKHGFEKQIRKASTDEDPPIFDRTKSDCAQILVLFSNQRTSKNTKTTYAFCRGKTPFGDGSQTIQRNQQFYYRVSVEVKRGAAPI